jgi:hypothetical protein
MLQEVEVEQLQLQLALAIAETAVILLCKQDRHQEHQKMVAGYMFAQVLVLPLLVVFIFMTEHQH